MRSKMTGAKKGDLVKLAWAVVTVRHGSIGSLGASYDMQSTSFARRFERLRMSASFCSVESAGLSL